jgi:hypothetical protein
LCSQPGEIVTDKESVIAVGINGDVFEKTIVTFWDGNERAYGWDQWSYQVKPREFLDRRLKFFGYELIEDNRLMFCPNCRHERSTCQGDPPQMK